MIFLGTGAAEAIPNPICNCRVCQNALNSKDPKEKRSRSSFLIDEHNLIDFGPDVISAAGRYGKPLNKLENLFFTHFHADHFSFCNMENFRMVQTPAPKVNIFMSEKAWEGIQVMKPIIQSYGRWKYDRDFKLYDELFTYHVLKPYDTVQAGEYTVSALPTIHTGYFHDETALNYLFEKDGKRFIYACDTGRYPFENFEFLKDKKLDYLIIEGSFGKMNLPEDSPHMCLDALQWMISKFKEYNCVDESTKIYITHIAHKGDLTHYEYIETIKKLLGDQAEVAFDGLDIGTL